CEWRSGTRHVSPRAYTMLTTLRDTVAEADRHLSGNDTLLWLRATNPALDGHRPLDVVRFDANRVRDAAARIAGHDVSEAS
ncbi:MAG TPA: antitoxin Xre/MbcA/ParS toxin-binding domain-containing protein, partial [Mycobacteriales bacterium]|nr:antitoxin Xre/MbcA/ParS toxin-binding domain-containing protein [Mycobacteriales bacterium]